VSLELNYASVSGKQTTNNIDKSRFASTVFTDDAMNTPISYLKPNVLQYRSGETFT
jgi:hypothetical protein